MATKPSKPKRRIRKVSSIRQQSIESNTQPARSKRSLGNRLASLLKAIGRVIAKVLRPFRFLLKPFQNKPMRAIGRFLGTIFGIRFLVRSWREVKQVKWPNRKQTVQLTLAVFIFALIFGAIITIIDYGLDKLFKQILLK